MRPSASLVSLLPSLLTLFLLPQSSTAAISGPVEGAFEPPVLPLISKILHGDNDTLTDFYETDSKLKRRAGVPDWWLADLQRLGSIPFGDGDTSYPVFRNVHDYGAVGDGSVDDTIAINNAINVTNRCGQGCGSSTIKPALVYFPPGTYLISSKLVMLYNTQLVGDAITMPTLKMSGKFATTGLAAMIDANPYGNDGNQWWANQNNFYRSIRNLRLDMTGNANMGMNAIGIHWPVAQATSISNVIFDMVVGGSGNTQCGIFMENGSGGFATNLTFNGGNIGAQIGSQQFTLTDVTFNNCGTAMYMFWDWGFLFKDIYINNCILGLSISSGGTTSQSVGSSILQDSVISNTPIAISTVYATTQNGTAGTFIIDNVDFSNNCSTAIYNAVTKTNVLAGNQVVQSFIQGRVYLDTGNVISATAVQSTQSYVTKPSSLLNSAGAVFRRTKPQYESYSASQVMSAKANGCAGDGVTDDTVAMQKLLDTAAAGNFLVYFDHGVYIVTATINVPVNIRITGEIWPKIMARGAAFTDASNPVVVWRVGATSGVAGTAEIADIVFETQGALPGAIMMEWNLASAAGASGMWDVHWRIGGSAGTLLQSDRCMKTPTVVTTADPNCYGSFLLLHITSQAAGFYGENLWGWVSDHELDRADQSQINIYNGRGLLVESYNGPTWLVGTSFEHSTLYQYQFANTANIYAGFVQTETPYMQSNPNALTPWAINPKYHDPDYSALCAGSNATLCMKSYGVRIYQSQDIFIYGAGLYSFFDNYDGVTCLTQQNCQTHMVGLDNSSYIYIFALSTKASYYAVTVDGVGTALDSDNRNTFCASIALYDLETTSDQCATNGTTNSSMSGIAGSSMAVSGNSSASAGSNTVITGNSTLTSSSSGAPSSSAS